MANKIRTIMINARVNESEHKALERGAKRAGKPVSSWLRDLGLQAEKEQRDAARK